jgi:hypothetical protein
MVVGVGGPIHVAAGPVVELLRINGRFARVAEALLVEIEAGWDLEVAAWLFAH